MRILGRSDRGVYSTNGDSVARSIASFETLLDALIRPNTPVGQPAVQVTVTKAAL